MLPATGFYGLPHPMPDQTAPLLTRAPATRLPPFRIIALAAAALVPLGLLHAWVLAETCIAVTDALFIAETIRAKNLTWLKQPWLLAALAWWSWLTICSIPFPGFTIDGWLMGTLEAFIVIRLILFTAALQSWLLTTPESRRLAGALLAASAAWIALESWQQFLTGHNLFGDVRWGDGALTGPFYKPRAGDLYGHLLFLAALPPAIALIARPGRLRPAAGYALLALGVVTSILIGQRMGTVFTALGLATSALVIRKLRRPALVIAAIAIAVLLLTPLISPATHAKLVGETATNLHHFSQSPYGELYTRATVMGLQSPWHGWGYRGFRAFCPLPRFSGGLPLMNIPPTQLALGACNLHPHNFYLQAFADAGFPGLLLFTSMMAIFLLTLGKNLWRSPDPLRVGIFALAVTFAWPLASTDEFPTLYMSGWLFFALGLGFALSQISSREGQTACQS
jgi:O-antigen ligase